MTGRKEAFIRPLIPYQVVSSAWLSSPPIIPGCLWHYHYHLLHAQTLPLYRALSQNTPPGDPKQSTMCQKNLKLIQSWARCRKLHLKQLENARICDEMKDGQVSTKLTDKKVLHMNHTSLAIRHRRLITGHHSWQDGGRFDDRSCSQDWFRVFHSSVQLSDGHRSPFVVAQEAQISCGQGARRVHLGQVFPT